MKPILLPALLFAALPLSAALDRSQKPEPGPAPEVAFPDYKTVTLKNGLKVFVIQDDRKPAVTFRVLIKGGDSVDGEKPGTAGFVATLLNRGTKTRDALTFAQESDYIGSQVGGSSGTDAISVGAGGLTKYTDKVLDLLVDAIVNPLFPEEQFSREQKKALSQLAAEKQEAGALGAKLASRVVYGGHPYGNIVTEESVAAITRDDLVKFHAKWFSPKNATLAVVGDVDADTIVPQLEKAFAAWKGGEVSPPKLPEPPAMKQLTIHLVDRPGSVQSNIIFTEPGPSRDTEDVPELNVLNATLGGGFSGRLFQNLREKHGWTYGAYSAFDMNRFGGAFMSSAETRNEVTAPAIGEMMVEIKRLREEPVGMLELELQRQYNVGNYLLSLESTARTAQRVQEIDLFGLDPDFYKTYAKRMATVTPEQIQSLAKSYLSLENAAIVVVGEARDIKPALEKLGPVTVYDTDLKAAPPAKK